MNGNFGLHGMITGLLALLAVQHFYANAALGPASDTLVKEADLIRELILKKGESPDLLRAVAHGERITASPDIHKRLAVARRLLGAQRRPAKARPQAARLDPSLVRIEQALLRLVSSSPHLERVVLGFSDLDSAALLLDELMAKAEEAARSMSKTAQDI